MRVPIAWVLVCLACWPAVGTAAFDPTDAFQFNVNAGFNHDNNLFRLPDNIDASQARVNSRSDTAFIKGAGLKFDAPVSRQRFVAEWNVSETTFDKNTDLDHSAYDGRAAWIWRIGNDLDGEASYRKRKTLGGFADEVLKVKDLVETEYYQLSGGYNIDARWRINAEWGKEDQSHSAFNRRTLDVESKTTGGRLTYRTPADNHVGLYARRTEREYPNRFLIGFDNNHTEDRIGLLGQWRPTGLLRVDASLGHVDVSHDELSSRDFSGYTWRAAGLWEATGKFRLSLAGFKDVRLYEDIATSYIVVHGVNVTPIYSVTSKITVQADFIYEKRDFRGDPGFLLGLIQREDDFRLARLGVTYSPFRNVDLSLAFETGERKSNIFFDSYGYQGWFGTARINF